MHVKVESIFERDFRKIYTAFKKPTRGKWKIGLFSNRISLNWNWQRDFCYETTHIQPHRSTSKFVAIRDKGPDFRYFSHTHKMLQSLLISLYSTDIKGIALYWCFATLTSLATYSKACLGNIFNFAVSYSLFLCHWLNTKQGNDFFLKRLKRRKKAETGANVVLLNFT